MNLFEAAMILTLVMDPLGNVPLFLSTLKNVPTERYRAIILREMGIALIILIIFLFFGSFLLKLLQLSDAALAIAGGLILLIISIKMIFPDYNVQAVDKKNQTEPFIVPLAIPLVAGPSSLTMVMLIPKNAGYLIALGALLIAWAITVLVLSSSSFLRSLLKERGLLAVEKLMGMILVVMAVQMLLHGTQLFLRS